MKKKGFTVKAHPLTVIFGCVYILIGDSAFTIAYILTLIFHEYVHYKTAKIVGVNTDGMVLTVFGGCLKGEFLGVKKTQILLITLVAPILNLVAVGLFFGLWWAFPSLYPYTEPLMYANLSIGLVNLLPCYPLDGGRAFLTFFPHKFTENLLTAVSVVASASLFVLFALSIKKAFNFSYLTMAAFLLWGAFYDRKKDGIAVKLLSKLAKRREGLEQVKIFKISENTPDHALLSELTNESYSLFITTKNGQIMSVRTEEEVIKSISLQTEKSVLQYK